MFGNFLNKFKTDAIFKAKVLLSLSLAFNIGYAVFLFVAGLMQQSKWFLVMAVYNTLLALTRLFAFGQIKPNKSTRSKIKAMRLCGYFLLIINIVVSAMMFLLIGGEHVVKHHEIVVITIAAYTFYTLTMAIVNSAKHIKNMDYTSMLIKIISLTAASVSMATLTDTMLATWGGEDLTLRSIILPILCVAIALYIIIGAILMIRMSNKYLRKLNDEESGK